MHLHHNAARPVTNAPLRCRPGEVFLTEDGKGVDVEAIVAAIERAPDDFRFGSVVLADLAPEIRGRTKLNFHHVASMARRDARRPLLLAERDDVGLILIDGRHRAARSKQLGYERGDAWILTATQWLAFCALSSAKS